MYALTCILMSMAVVMLSIFVTRFKTNTFNNPVTYFSLWWGFWVILSSFGFYGLNIPSIRTYIIINLCVLSFCIGCIVVLRKFNSTDSGQHFFKSDLKVNNRIQIVLMLILLYFVYRSLNVILSYGITIQEFRGYAFISNSEIDPLFGSTQIRLLFSIIVPPLVLGNTLIEISKYFLMGLKKENRWSLYLSISNLILYNLIMMGRIEIFRFILFVVLGIFIVKGVKQSKKIKNIKSKVLMLVLMILFFTYIRTNESESVLAYLFKSIIVYFTGSFIALDQFLNIYFIQPVFEYKFGGAFIGGIQELYILALRRIDKTAESVNLELSGYANQAINIGSDQHYNAFYTMIYNFFADGGLIAAVICSLIFGLIVGFSYNYYKRKTSAFSLSLYIYLLHLAIFASLRWELTGTWAWLVLPVLYYFSGKKLKQESQL